jgi:hypothetical protein
MHCLWLANFPFKNMPATYGIVFGFFIEACVLMVAWLMATVTL